jgi:hypothetical protein
MLGPRSNAKSPAKPQAVRQPFPLYALSALNLDEQPGDGAIGQGTPLPQTLPVAVFPQEENYLVPVYFAADTAFDCEDGDGAPGWASFAD